MLTPFFVVAALLAIGLVARWITNWIANRPDSFKPPPLQTGQPNDAAMMLQDQVSAKILWDAPDHEVLEWLEEKHQITGERAAAMLSVAKVARMRTIREKALYGVIFSGATVLALGGILATQWFGGVIFVRSSILFAVALVFCAFWLVKYLKRLLTGRTDSSAGL